MYAQLSSSQVDSKDFTGNLSALPQIAELLQHLSFNQVTAAVAAGATGVTVDEYVFVAPTKLKITNVGFLKTVVQTGSGNTPVVSLRAGANEVGNTGAIQLAGAVGDVSPLTLDPAQVTIAMGTKLIFRIVNPTATITVALAGKLLIEWEATV
jgi:hypothetical protein